MPTQQNDRSPDTTCLYAWLSRDADGIEGLIAAPIGDLIYPLVCTDQDRAEKMADLASYVAQERHMPAFLVKFTRTETLRTIGG